MNQSQPSPICRQNVANLIPYMPGEQPKTGTTIKLNTNENPYPPSEKVMTAIREVSPLALRRYPDATSAPFRQVAARLHAVSPDQIIATNGGDELLRMVIGAYCEPKPGAGEQHTDGGMGVTDPTYSLYPILANIHGNHVTVVPRCDDFSFAPDLAKGWNEAGCRLGFIVNPHAPTGLLASMEMIRKIAGEFNGLLMVDEAYVDFANQDCLALVKEGLRNVIILRSLSKGYGLAGLRFGYGIGHADVIETLHKVRDSYNCDAISQAAAVAALEDQDYYQGVWQKVIQERKRLVEALSKRGFLTAESQTNFILTQVRRPTMEEAINFAQSIYQALKQRQIFVRYFDLPRLQDKLRISIGTPEENEQLLTALDDIFAEL